MQTTLLLFAAEWLFFALAICLIGLVALVFGGLWMYRDALSRGMDATVWILLLIVASLAAGIIGFASSSSSISLPARIIRSEADSGWIRTVRSYPPRMISEPCPVCFSPMTWYPQYQRWYCHSCGQYR